MSKLRLSTFRVGDDPKRGEGLRIAVTRRPPRGVPKARWVRERWFDVWFPNLAPSQRLLARYKRRDWDDRSVREAFFDDYERELLASAEGRQAVALMVGIARRMPVSVGCYCADEAYCHRSRLRSIIVRQSKKP